jgi:hypothetical protein
MDTLDVLKKAEEEGGPLRREAMTELLKMARDIGCRYTVSGGRTGGFNLRYGSIRYYIMDIYCDGGVILHIKPHPDKDITDEQRDEANEFLEGLGELEISNMPVNHYTQLEDPIEEIPMDALEEFLEYIVSFIREHYYKPHLERQQQSF